MAIADRESLHRAIDELPEDSLEEASVLLLYLRHRKTHPGSAWLRTLHEIFEPVREGAAYMSEDEINQILDEALEEVRREHDA